MTDIERKAILAACDALQNSRDFLKSALGKWDRLYRQREINQATDNLRDAAEALGFDLVARETVRPLTVTTDDRAADEIPGYR